MNILVYIVRWVRGLFGVTPELLDRKFHQNRQIEQIKAYLQKHEIRRLQIGSQRHIYDTWLNTDLTPKSADITYLDATQRFPIADNTFNYIFTEHMIEHITYDDGKNMLAECHRILIDGGKIRISTPDLAFLASLYNADLSEIQKEYIAFSVKRYSNGNVSEKRSFVVNNFFNSFGHKFIYDRSTLSNLLEVTGFKNAKFCNVKESSDPELSDLETHGSEITETFNQLESMVIEAEK